MDGILELGGDFVRVDPRISSGQLANLLLQRDRFCPHFYPLNFDLSIDQFFQNNWPGLCGFEWGSFQEVALGNQIAEKYKSAISQASLEVESLKKRFFRELEGYGFDSWWQSQLTPYFKELTLRTWPRPLKLSWLWGSFNSLGAFGLTHPDLLKAKPHFYGFYQIGPRVEVLLGQAQGELFPIQEDLPNLLPVIWNHKGQARLIRLGQVPDCFGRFNSLGQREVKLPPENLPAFLAELEQWLAARNLSYEVTGNAGQGRLTVRSVADISRELSDSAFTCGGFLNDRRYLPTQPKRLFQTAQKILENCLQGGA